MAMDAMDATGLRLYLEVGGSTVEVAVIVFRVAVDIEEVRAEVTLLTLLSSPRLISGLESSTMLVFSSVLGALTLSLRCASAPTEIFSSTDPEPVELGR